MNRSAASICPRLQSFAVQSASFIDTSLSQIKEGFESGRYKVRDVGFQIIKCLTEDKLQRYNSIDGTYSGYSAPDRREDGDNRRNIGYGGIGHVGEGVSSRDQEDAGVSDYRRAINFDGQLSLEDSVSPRDEFMEGFHAFWEKVRASGVWYQQDWLDLLKEHPAYDFVNRITKEGDSNVNKKVKLATFRSLPEIIERGTLLEDDADNYHKADSSVKYAYIEAEVLIEGKPFAITVSIRKSEQKNLFWVHSVDIKRTARQAGSPYGLSRAKKSNGSKQSLQRKKKKVKRDVRYSREVSGADAMRFVDAFYTRDTVKPSVDDRVVEINREWLLDQFDAGRYYAIAKTLSEHTGISENEAWNKLAPLLLKKEGVAKYDGKTFASITELSEKSLRKALELGGFAAPSIGIVDLDNPTTGFGDITFIFPSWRFNADADPTFDGDAEEALRFRSK